MTTHFSEYLVYSNSGTTYRTVRKMAFQLNELKDYLGIGGKKGRKSCMIQNNYRETVNLIVKGTYLKLIAFFNQKDLNQRMKQEFTKWQMILQYGWRADMCLHKQLQQITKKGRGREGGGRQAKTLFIHLPGEAIKRDSKYTERCSPTNNQDKTKTPTVATQTPSSQHVQDYQTGRVRGVNEDVRQWNSS